MSDTPAPRAPHGCGLCGGTLRHDGVHGAHDTYVCVSCGWWHISADCCDRKDNTIYDIEYIETARWRVAVEAASAEQARERFWANEVIAEAKHIEIESTDIDSITRREP